VVVATCAVSALSVKGEGMRKLKSKADIWVLTPNVDDLKAGAYYAAVSMPWTYNRLNANTSSAGQKGRALNIAKGIVGQQMLEREMVRRGLKAQAQLKSYRDEDLYDLHVDFNGALTKLDLKTVNYFTNYKPVGRESFSRDLLLTHAGYAGADWRTFFPMLVGHSQIEQSKEAYCFAIATSIDLRNDIDTNRADYALTAFPYGEYLSFLSSTKLCLLREEDNKGIFLELSYETDSIVASDITLSIIGEWAGKPRVQPVKLKPNVAQTAGPFSCVASFQVDRNSYDVFYGAVEISVKKNEFSKAVLNSTKRNLNAIPKETFVLTHADFCNLFLPNDYTLYVVGWIYKDEFLKACRRYTGWVWPLDKVDKYSNRPWEITEDDKTRLEGIGFASSIEGKSLKAGWLKTHGRGGGACCFVYPNIGAHGGVKETNLYVLPQDLYTMDALK
jgi:hypothetical protein